MEKAIIKYGNLYDYSKVIYKGNKIAVEIICPTHNIISIRPDEHLKNNSLGCQKCNREVSRLKYVNVNWINECVELFDNKYDYSKVNYINNKTTVEIVCPIHGSFFMKPNTHKVQKQGCKKCGGKKVFNTREFIQESNKRHNNIYDYSLVNYISSHNKVEIICKKHNKFIIKPCDHLNGQGCRKCGMDNSAKNRRKNIIDVINSLYELYGNLYDYSKVNYINNITDIELVCNTHGSFFKTFKELKKGGGCQKCMCSKGELKIIKILDDMDITYEYQKTFSNCLSADLNILRFDFYIPNMNLCIEYDGYQHFEPVKFFGGVESFNKLKYNDGAKDKYCERNKIKLHRIPYYEYNNLDFIINDIFNKLF